jgi:hypothetical protein
MANSPDSLPLADQPGDDRALLARAFWLLLDHGRPLEVGVLADALQREPAALAAAVDRLEQAGLTRRDPAGRLLGSQGLSVAPTTPAGCCPPGGPPTPTGAQEGTHAHQD